MLIRVPSEAPHKLHLRNLVASCMGLVIVAACGSVNSASVASPWHAVDLPGMPSGLRGAVYDSTRDCLWIMTRPLMQDGVPVITLTRLNVTSVTASPTSLQLAGQGYIAGVIGIDAKAKVWLGWGTTLARYDPVTASSQTWQVPNFAGQTHQTQNPGLDGNMVALAIDPAGEVWVAAYGVRAIFGFNSVTNSWDRTIHLSIDPFRGTRLSFLQTGQLMMNGRESLLPSRSTVEIINAATGAEIGLGLRAIDYVISDAGHAIYVDDSGSVGKITLANASTTVITGPAPMAAEPHLTVDPTGNVWFSMRTRDLVGVGKLDVLSGAVQPYPLPQPPAASIGADPACPPQAAFGCSKFNATLDPQIQAVIADPRGNVWVITRANGSGDTHSFSGMSPVYELTQE